MYKLLLAHSSKVIYVHHQRLYDQVAPFPVSQSQGLGGFEKVCKLLGQVSFYQFVLSQDFLMISKGHISQHHFLWRLYLEGKIQLQTQFRKLRIK